MKKIPLTNEKFALVDDEDFDDLIKFKWYASRYYKDHCFYAIRREGNKTILMHRQIMRTPKGMVTDHKDHDGLNNQRSNLRICTHAENIRNSEKTFNGTSKYRGVSVKDMGKNKYYRGRIFLNGKEVVKTFPYTQEGEIMAAQFYNEQAKIHYGQFANINFGQ